MSYSSMDYWFCIVIGDEQNLEFVEKMYDALMNEYPRVLSVVAERACDFQCCHCIFQKESSSRRISEANMFNEAVLTIAAQMDKPMIVHEGRIFKPRHLEWLIRLQSSNHRIGMIDNGSFMRYVDEIKQCGVMFDWLDISIDGPPDVHNLQRKTRCFDMALKGISAAPMVLKDGGKLTSLFTLTKINHSSILETCKILPKEIEEWHITTISPLRREIAHLSVSDGEFVTAWKQIVAANKLRNIFFRIYVVEDLLKLARATGKEKFINTLTNAKVASSAIIFEIDGVRITYYPQSVSPGETFVIDADACYRVPYSIAYTLKELQMGRSRSGENLQTYTVGKITASSDFHLLFRKDVLKWKQNFGRKALEKEIAIFRGIRYRKEG